MRFARCLVHCCPSLTLLASVLGGLGIGACGGPLRPAAATSGAASGVSRSAEVEDCASDGDDCDEDGDCCTGGCSDGSCASGGGSGGGGGSGTSSGCQVDADCTNFCSGAAGTCVTSGPNQGSCNCPPPPPTTPGACCDLTCPNGTTRFCQPGTAGDCSQCASYDCSCPPPPPGCYPKGTALSAFTSPSVCCSGMAMCAPNSYLDCWCL
jgi:hypothetical protein